MSKHTRGPWTAEGKCVCDGDNRKILFVLRHPYGRHADGNLDDDELDANTRLTAAAPEMLEALRNVQKLIAEAAMAGFSIKDTDWPERLFHSQQRTDAAIRKAEGRELKSLADAVNSQ